MGCRKDFEDDELYSLMQMLKKQTITMQRSVLQKNIIGTILLTKKNDPPPGAHVFLPTGTIFEVIQDIIGTNLLNKFHDDRTINVSIRVLTRFNDSHLGKNALSPGSHVFQTTGIFFELIQDIIGTPTLLPMLTRKTDTAPMRPSTGTIFKLVQDIMGTLNVDSRVLRSVYYSHTWKNAPPPGGHVVKPARTIFKLVQHTHLFTKCHEDANVDAAQRTSLDGQKAITKAHYEHILLKRAKNGPTYE
ncbi:hypothetical protein DPMN_111739 [Dreissena polymorpha]|uniref:Uncharacterized protein n=1 Tax=Dreissena polymorpha TaxID=45954 RepID=A0A9D4KFS0_DREPO|nr:hypothetical protein DPMN_111739 [Dreissena polymorpha]